MSSTRDDRVDAGPVESAPEPAPSSAGTQAGHPVEDHGISTRDAWRALVALVVGFFMILIDTTIVSVAMPHIITGLNTTLTAAIWVTSAYLLAYAVPLLITGRLGDRYGPKNLYLIGLAVFTLSSLACGLSGTAAALITWRVVQGLGAALMTPQTMAVITRLFPPKERAQAMSLWGATAGVAMLVGPLLGGLLTDGFGWEWIFFINVPVGVLGFLAAVRLVPALPVHSHSFDWLGVALSAIGTFLLVFGIQEGNTYHWAGITDDLTIGGLHTHVPVSVPGLIIIGTLVLVAFVAWQALNKREPLVPLGLFRDRNFSAANAAITVMGFCVVGTSFPLMLFYQEVKGLTPTQAALTMIPMALLSGGLAPLTGKLQTQVNPKWLAVLGFLLFSASQVWAWSITKADTPIWMFLLPLALLGLANSLIWGPLSMTATRNLPPRLAGAGSGIYNTTRQMGSVLGSASIAAVMSSRLQVQMTKAVDALPPAQRAHIPAGTSTEGFSGALPAFLHDAFATAMGQSLLLGAAAILLGLVAALFFAKPPLST
ncbi:DHA2 family efflux MFS transporter permease subunit [Raineyella fluvialis]|uniref:DHA2 family efflux MFS transporter permease subunit n=1 Tax=Raineyella fluvialis TaxID=2662261 RepID=A0A5Q2F9Y5_9ACTN|nr:DHA2 family efflux MFS transporter permease subunit [Raineyella fluvialis]QGF23191.1 DHA2 family efflux MFS transporter permease subunit [Raineyella fluvialis]